MIERDPIRREVRRFLEFVLDRWPYAYKATEQEMAAWRLELRSGQRDSETQALRLYALSALSPDCPLRGMILHSFAMLEKSTLARLAEAARMLAGDDRRWAVDTLSRADDLRRKAALTHTVEASVRFYAQRVACIAHAAHRLEKLHRKRIQSRAA